MTTSHLGGCHCGNIRFVFERDDDKPLAARACGCTFCQKHGGVWTSDPRGRLRYSIARDDAAQRYEFGTRTAQFLLCRRCGVAPLVLSEIDATTYAVVSVRAFEPRLQTSSDAADFSAESVDERLRRRAQNWIGRVERVAAVN